MKKRIVIVDDRPWKMLKSVQQLQNDGCIFYETIYYPNGMIDREKQDVLMKEYRKGTGLSVTEVNDCASFVTRMDELYTKPDIVFLVDYDLKGDMSLERFNDRINVRYALLKDTERRIWFYTSWPKDVRARLKEVFPGWIIDVPVFCEGQLYWDVEQVKSIVDVSN